MVRVLAATSGAPPRAFSPNPEARRTRGSARAFPSRARHHARMHRTSPFLLTVLAVAACGGAKPTPAAASLPTLTYFTMKG